MTTAVRAATVGTKRQTRTTRQVNKTGDRWGVNYDGGVTTYEAVNRDGTPHPLADHLCIVHIHKGLNYALSFRRDEHDDFQTVPLAKLPPLQDAKTIRAVALHGSKWASIGLN